MTSTQRFIHRCGIVLLSLLSECIKCKLFLTKFHLKEEGINRTQKRNKKIILSLTSYGRRLSKTAPYAIYSLLKQTMKPDLVILWLDNENWNDANLPASIRHLCQYGLSVRYCDDIRSYKKHVPTLSLFPDDLVITVDDDFYYSSKMVEKIYSGYLDHPNSIVTLRAHRVLFDTNGKRLPYEQWDMMQHDTAEGPLFATTGGGCLLQLSLLHNDTLKPELFLSLCPTADDVWFYFMTLMQKTQIVVLPQWSVFMMIPMDVFYQKTHAQTSLQEVNRGLSANDRQISAMMEHYNLIDKNLQQL